MSSTPVPYTVRNTFIDVEEAADADSAAVFHTWSGTVTVPQHSPCGGRVGDCGFFPGGETLSSIAEPRQQQQQYAVSARGTGGQRVVGPQPARLVRELSLEEGEVPEDEDDSDEEGVQEAVPNVRAPSSTWRTNTPSPDPFEEGEVGESEEEAPEEGEVHEGDVDSFDPVVGAQTAGLAGPTAVSISADPAVASAAAVVSSATPAGTASPTRPAAFPSQGQPPPLPQSPALPLGPGTGSGAAAASREGAVPATAAGAAGRAEGLGSAAPPLCSQEVAEAHRIGKCKPCAWLHKSAEGCRNGSSCSYCHLCPAGEIKRRKKEKQTAKIQQGVLLASRPALSSNRPCAAGQVVEPRYINASDLGIMLPSVGSVDHAAGQCRPCAWVHKGPGCCKYGAACGYCHLCPPGELKRRKRRRWEEAARSNLGAATLVPAARGDAATGATYPGPLPGPPCSAPPFPVEACPPPPYAPVILPPALPPQALPHGLPLQVLPPRASFPHSLLQAAPHHANAPLGDESEEGEASPAASGNAENEQNVWRTLDIWGGDGVS